MDRLNIMGIKSLEYRRVEFDLVVLFKIIHKIIHVDFDKHFKFSTFSDHYSLRRHPLHLQRNKAPKTGVRNHFFSYRVVETWNKLPEEIVLSRTLHCFKFHLKRFDLNSVYDFVF